MSTQIRLIAALSLLSLVSVDAAQAIPQCTEQGGADTCSAYTTDWEHQSSCAWPPWEDQVDVMCEQVQGGTFVGSTCVDPVLPYPTFSESLVDDMLEEFLQLVEHWNPSCGALDIDRTPWAADGETTADYGISSPPCYLTVDYDGSHQVGNFRTMRLSGMGGASCTSPIDQLFVPTRSRQLKCPAGYEMDLDTLGRSVCHKRQEDVCGIGNPTRPALGTKYHQETDVTTGVPNLRFTRYYNSNSFDYRPTETNIERLLPMGHHWSHEYNSQLFEIMNGTVMATLIEADGRIKTYGLDGYETDGFKGTKSRLTRLSDGTGDTTGWLLHKANDAIESYDVSGRLQQIEYPSGEVLTLTYSDAATPDSVAPRAGFLISVSNRQGRSLSITYNNDELIDSVQDPSGEVYLYTYHKRLIEDVTYPSSAGGVTKTYHYEDTSRSHLLTGITDERGTRYSTYAYDSLGRVDYTEHAGGVGRHAFDYSQPDRTVVTDPLGTDRSYDFVTVNGVIKNTGVSEPCSSCGQVSQNTTYDAHGNPNIVTDFEGNVTDYDYDSRGLLIARTDAVNTAEQRKTVHVPHPELNQITSTSLFDASNDLVSKIDRSYNDRGQLLTETVRDVGDSKPDDRTTVYTYCDEVDEAMGCPLIGLLRTMDPPGAVGLTTYDYYLSTEDNPQHRTGDLKAIFNSKNHETRYDEYDASGRPVLITDANGVETSITYTSRGWIKTRTVNGTQTTTFDYEPFGAIKQVTQADGSYLHYSYDDAQRLTRITDAAGAYVEYTLDNAGNRVEEINYNSADKLKRRIERVYDDLGRLQDMLNASGAITTYSYDANGNLSTVIDPENADIDQTNEYDPLNRLITTLDALGYTTSYEYDERDNLVEVTDGRGLVTSYTYDGLNDLVQLDSPDTGTTTYTYNDAGQRSQAIDANGVTTNYTYDSLGRLKTVSYPSDSSLDVSFRYDTDMGICSAWGNNHNGRLDRMWDAATNTRYCYDAFGNIVRKSQRVPRDAGVFYDVQYGYNAANRLASVKYPSGHIASYTRDQVGRIKGINITLAGQSPTPVINNVIYKSFGPLSRIDWADGKWLKHSYDFNFWPSAAQSNRGGGIDLTFATDTVGNIIEAHDGLVESYTYDATYRLLTSDSHSLLYDEVGNRISNGAHSYNYALNSNRLLGYGDENADPTAVPVDTTKAGGTLPVETWTSFQFDNNGNITDSVPIPGARHDFHYGPQNRLSSVDTNGQQSSQYFYNGKGERVRKIGQFGVEHIYVYNESGQLIYYKFGSIEQDIIWLDQFPVAVIQNDAIYTIEADHLGTPRRVVDASGVVVWKWQYLGNAFGELAADSDPDGDGTHFIFNLRFPGQQFDAETGLHYNYFRDYDPRTGRYMQSDPIGLGGGVNTYGYVGQNPLGFTDPTGLVKWSCTFSSLSIGPSLTPIVSYGGFGMDYTCTSECVDGRALQVNGHAGGGMISASPIPFVSYTQTWGNETIILDDGEERLNARNLNGSATISGLNFVILAGGSYGEMNLGLARSGVGPSQLGGLDVSISHSWGFSNVIPPSKKLSWPDCQSCDAYNRANFYD